MNRIEATETSANGLHRDYYWFYLDSGLRLFLDGYSDESRPTKRHGWRITDQWTRVDQRSNTIPQPEVPEDIVSAAMLDVRSRVKYVPKWSRL